MCSRESMETSPLLRYASKDSPIYIHPRKGVVHHRPDPSTSSLSRSRSPIHKLRRSFSTGSLLSLDLAVSKDSEISLLSPSKPSRPLWKWIELRLENSGSVARDHLASERTFLAYMRTSLAIVSSGVALVQLFRVSSPRPSAYTLHAYIRPLGASTVIAGLLVLFIGITRYFTVQVCLTKGSFPVARLAIGFMAIMLGVLVTLTFAILLAVPKGK